MDFRFTKEEEIFRNEVVSFIDQNLPWDWKTALVDPEEPEWIPLVRQFRKSLASRGWLTLAWPKEFGGQGDSHSMQIVLNEEMAYRDILAIDNGVRMVAPTLMLYGTPEQKRYFLCRISQADITWAQGYSEPDAGSDLASLQTRAEEDDDDFIVNGAKIWNGAHGGAEWMFMLARTDPNAPKHRGISFLLVDLRSPGIKIERIPMMWNGCRSLVTFQNVRVSKRNLVGEKNRGWYVAATLLDFERSGVERPARAKRIVEDIVSFLKNGNSTGRSLLKKQVIRSRLAEMAIEVDVCRLLCYKVAWMQGQGLLPNKEASLAKLFGAEILAKVHSLAMDVMGLYGPLEPCSRYVAFQGRIQRDFYRYQGLIQAAGSSEVQRNIVATRGLGLPRG